MTQSLDARRWQVVEDYWTNGGEKCNPDCPFYRQQYQSHPYGSTTASEDVSECQLLADGTDPTKCPGYQEPEESDV